MPRWPHLALIAALLLAAPARAAPVDPAQQAEVLAVYDKWNKAVLAGKLKEGMAVRTAAMRARIAADIKTPAAERNALEMLKSMTPSGVEVLRATANKAGDRITLIAVLSTVMPKGVKTPGAPPAGTILRSESTLVFAREGGVWKYDQVTWGMDPAKVKPCGTEFGRLEDYDDDRDMQMGGQIRRVEFKDTHTLVVIRMFDEENCIFMPNKAKLTELGLDTSFLVPWAMIEITAFPHRGDSQRVWADSVGVSLED